MQTNKYNRKRIRDIQPEEIGDYDPSDEDIHQIEHLSPSFLGARDRIAIREKNIERAQYQRQRWLTNM